MSIEIAFRRLPARCGHFSCNKGLVFKAGRKRDGRWRARAAERAGKCLVRPCREKRLSLLTSHAEQDRSQDRRAASAEELARHKQELEEQLAALQAQINNLSPEELQQFSEIVKTDLPVQAQAKDQQAESDTKDQDQAASKSPDFVEIPVEIRKMLQEAGVEGAMGWNGIPATAQDMDDDFGFSEGILGPDADVDSSKPDAARLRGLVEGPDWPENEDDEALEGDDERTFEPGEGVAEMVAKLERGEPLGPDPRYEGLKTESCEAFQARMLKYRQAYEAQYLDRKDWKISVEDYKEIVNEKIRDDFPPWETPEITQVQPAPDWPEPIYQQHYDRAQWILFLLRKCYKLPQPDLAPKALFNDDLVSDAVVFEDPYIESIGIQAWIDYTERVNNAGGIIEIGHIWSELGTQKPYPKWIIWVDLWLSIPYPYWYHEYMEIHSQFDDPPNLGTGKEARPDPFAPEPNYWRPPPLRFPKGRIKLEDLLKQSERPAERVPTMGSDGPWSRNQDPQNPKSTGFKKSFQQQEQRREYSISRMEANAYEPGYESPLPTGPQKEEEEIYAEEERGEQDRISKLQAGLDNFVLDETVKHSAEAFRWQPDLEEMTLLSTMRECGRQAESADPGCPDAHEPALLDYRKPPGFRYCTGHSPAEAPRSRRLVAHEVGTQSASAGKPSWKPSFNAVASTVQEELRGVSWKKRLQSVTGAEVPESEGIKGGSYRVLRYRDSQSRRGQRVPETRDPEDWPECSDPGQAWRSGRYFSIPMTIAHKIDNDLGQVRSVHVEWGAILGHVIGTQQDLLDVYARELLLWEHHDPSCQRIKVARR